jgi:hypothetical protein
MNWDQLTAIGKEKLLDAMGLEERRSTSSKIFSTLGIFAFGALVGGAVALLLAPQSGDELRKVISAKFAKFTGIGGDGKETEEFGSSARTSPQKPATARPTSNV